MRPPFLRYGRTWRAHVVALGPRRPRLHYGWIVMLVGMLATVGAHGFGRMSYTLILPSMREGLALSYTQAGLLGTGNFVGYLASSFIGGLLAARYNSRHLISLSLVLMGITMFLTGAADSFAWALAMRLLTGLGNGAVFVPAMALGSVWFAMRYRGLATGIVSGGIGVGTMLGALLIPRILEAYGPAGWSFAWYYLGGLVLAISAICYAFLRARPEEVGLLPVGSQAPGVVAAEAGSGGGKVGSLQWILVCRKKEVWHLGLVYFMFGFSYVIYMTFFAAYLRNEIGWTAERASSLWALVGALSIFCGVLWGWVSDRVGRRNGAALVYLTLAVSYLLFALFRSAPAFYLSATLFGLSAWSIPTIMAAASGDYVGRELAPAGLGFVTLFFGVGQALGPYVGGYLADAAQTFTWAFVLAAVVSLGGLAGSLLLRRPQPEPEAGAAGLKD